jgi:signal transduction histidine kinase
MKSIANRIHRAIFLVSLVSMAVMVFTVLIVNEDLERTMLRVEFAEEHDFFLAHRPADEITRWETSNLVLLYQPLQKGDPDDLPKIFQGLPIGYTGELDRGDQTYMVRISPVEKGHLYIAKNISHFEGRERLFQAALGVIVLMVLGLSLFLAVLNSRRIVKPLQDLAENIHAIPVGQKMPRLSLSYQDSELRSIAEAFNIFLGELESFVKREQALLSLASHELRTPIAVVSGALDIVEQRNQLNEADRATIARIRRATSEMGANVNILLKLARRETRPEAHQPIALVTIVQQALDDLSSDYHVKARVTLQATAAINVYADPVMVKMLIRNVIQNALQHTLKRITVRLTPGLIEIIDEGEGLTSEQQSIIVNKKKPFADNAPVGGLGLYLVTLISERLDWRLDIAGTGADGTVIHIHTH